MKILSMSSSCSGEDSQGYEVIKNNDTIVIKPSNLLGAGDWTEKGLKNSIEVEDSGNGIKIRYEYGTKKLQLDYAQAHDLLLALTLYHDHTDNKYKFLKVEEL